MVGRYKNIALDFVALVLTIFAALLQNIGFFVGPWWTNEGTVGTSSYGMTGFKICIVSCVDKTVMDIESGREWMFAVRLFEVFGECCVVLALIMAILAVTVRLRAIRTSVVYIHGAAAVFILLGVFIFLAFHTTLDKDLQVTGSSQYPCFLCLTAAIFCMMSSFVSGYALKEHLLEWDDNDDDDANLVA